MKDRILDSLALFANASPLEEKGALFREICSDLAIPPEKLQQKSRLVLKHILHNYAFFEVSTIDRFNHKIIKTFARDLQLSQNFEVELDLELLLEQAVGQLLAKAGTDHILTQMLLDFSLQKIDDNKSWNITYDLVEIGKLLFQENHSSQINTLVSKSITDFRQIQKNILRQLEMIERQVVGESQKTVQEIENQGFNASDFPRQTLPNHFKKIIGGEFNVKVLYSNRLESNLVENKILKSGDARDISGLSNYLLDRFLYIKKNLYRHNYLKNIYGNIVPMTLLNEIAKEIKNIEADRDIIPISALNAILSKEIKNQPVPFIYERMGEKYRHYFIDEFQDTSQMQWENLIPLIGNALEGENERNEQGSLFLVGDVKQAIYRWRGGKAEQFLDLLNSKSRPFVVSPSVHALDTNWRSYNEIVKFNNGFFRVTAPFFKNETYKDLFLKGSSQKTTNREGGFVQLSFLRKGAGGIEDVYCRQVLDAISLITSKQHSYSDICILVRDNSKGMLLANFLSENRIPIISSDALLLKNNVKVIFLISLLKFIGNHTDLEAVFQILSFLASVKNEKHSFISSNLHRLESLLMEDYAFSVQELRASPVLDILETAIVRFDLVDGAEAYLTFLMDEVLILEKKEGPGIFAFLRYWEQKKTSISIAAPDDVNAVKIMTVHKSKGLEFPFVVFPFANIVIDDKRKKKKLWVANPEEEELGMEELLLNAKQEMLYYNELAAHAYSTESEKTELDALNVLYVALTRAEKGLFIFCEKVKEQASLSSAQTYSDLFQYYIDSLDAFENEKETYTFGSFPEHTGPAEHENINHKRIPYITGGKEGSDFIISTKSGSLWDDEKMEAIQLGNLIHFILSQIITADDVSQVLAKLLSSGHIEKGSEDFIGQKILDVVHHPQLNEFFSNKFQVFNEKEILTVDNRSVRPDRVVIADNEAYIIDYKTGKPSPAYREQIIGYADALTAMGYTVKNSIIVYIDHNINPVFL